ncbi:hypothetical protein CW670_03000 [Macrococcoides caseolyticum]|uniref:Uncharacterized protein n=1 Tax=Macrococcoides caseolyticum TaxID=69966 RepID=A0ACC9MVU0_9STAP|nr:hypothetical protein CW718_10615 [Macrococcus caseolyticus]PKE36917.1 hypothetical protein CW695_00750 [Macrococcus caseolyticus]PKE39958.1 hypothetical protein CW675_03220 [Macrococcus caseolyticus]PKE57106.1 hypothetical protein CW682_02565 [Macrococcus caseolyticus]PKE60018.1 hypothetical protein CW669_10940 [Macrococcus caseolyticus]
MIKELIQNFFQTSFLSLIWLMTITSLFNTDITVHYNYFWRLILISILFGLSFGVLYPYLWKYSTTKSTFNVILCSTDNTFIILCSIYLYSSLLFTQVYPYIYAIAVINLILHYVIFKLYSDYLNQKYIMEIQNSKRL